MKPRLSYISQFCQSAGWFSTRFPWGGQLGWKVPRWPHSHVTRLRWAFGWATCRPSVRPLPVRDARLASLPGGRRVMSREGRGRRAIAFEGLVVPVSRHGRRSWSARKTDMNAPIPLKHGFWGRALRRPWTSRKVDKGVLEQTKPETSPEAKTTERKLTERKVAGSWGMT